MDRQIRRNATFPIDRKSDRNRRGRFVNDYLYTFLLNVQRQNRVFGNVQSIVNA